MGRGGGGGDVGDILQTATLPNLPTRRKTDIPIVFTVCVSFDPNGNFSSTI